MRIIFLSRRFLPHTGGVERHIFHLSQELGLRGHQITVLTQQHQAEVPLQEELSGIQIFRLPQNTETSKLKLWQAVWQQRGLFQAADVIHVHDVGWWTLPVFPWIWWKWFITFHGWEGEFPPRKQAIRQRRLWAALAQGVVQVGSFIESWYGTKPDVLTFGAVTPANHKRLKLAQPPQVVFLGRLVAENDLDLVLAALRTLSITQPNLECLFVGDGPLHERCAKLGIVTGMVDEVRPYIQTATVVIANSYLSILEAQALGKLVVSLYSHPLKAEYLTSLPSAEGMIITNQPKDAAQEIAAFLNSPVNWSESIKKAQSWAGQQTWKKLADQYESLWEKQKSA